MRHGINPNKNAPDKSGRFVGCVFLQTVHSIKEGTAAVPSLHAAYMLIATVYAAISKQKHITTIVFAFICMGIWWTAVYSCHHYIIDVLLGILTAVLGILILEKVLFKIKSVAQGMAAYISHI